MIMKRLLFVSLPVGLLILNGCAQPPTIELNAAQRAIEDARKTQTDKYAAAEFGSAQKALNEATAAINTQDKGFVLTRNYTKAKDLLKDAEAKAQDAQKLAKENKEKTIQEVEALIQDTTASLEAATATLEKAPKGRTSQADVAALKGDVDTLIMALDQGKDLAANGEYLEAKASLTQTKQRALDISAQIQNVAEKGKAKKTS
jgi:predicted transcriptional regulator